MNNINQTLYQNPYLVQRNNGILWVQGIEGAKAWQLAPNSNVMLLDSEIEGRFYIKTSDNIGMCNLRSFNYTEVTDEPKETLDLSKYVTREEFKEVINSLTREEKYEQSVQSTKQYAKPKLLAE